MDLLVSKRKLSIGVKLTMRPDDERRDDSYGEQARKRDEYGLRERLHGKGVDANEDDWANNARKSMCHADSSKNLSNTFLRYMFRQGRLGCGTTQTSECRQHATQEEESSRTDKDIAKDANDVRNQGKPQYPEIKPVRTSVSIHWNGARFAT
jgi:hypothetical protein